MQKEFALRHIPYEQESKLDIFYKEELLSKYYVADFICFYDIIVELKALSALDSSHEAQMLNYLKATGSKLGVLINFGAPKLEYKRMVY